MSYTWKDIKLASLQKMFAADGDQIVADESTKDYLAGMPYAANEGLDRLATAGKFITKSLNLAHLPAKNLLSENDYSAENGHSYYFQFSGIGTAVISGGDSDVTIDINSYGTFTEFKGNYANSSNGKVTITFSSDYPYKVKNAAIYAETFPTINGIDMVPEYGEYVKYDLKELAPSFYNVFGNTIVYEGESSKVYLNTTDYYKESDHILVLPKDKPGMYTVYYNAYPGLITLETEDDYVLEVDKEVAALLPLYIASQLYKDDDNGIATTYRNEFEVGLEALINSASNPGKEKFTSEWV
jgi:hypothetical protein